MERAVELARARWRKIRAATLVFVLFRRRATHGASAARHATRQPKRTHTSVFFAKQSVQAAAVAAAQRLATAPSAAASPQAAKWFEQKLRLFERITRKPIQNRTDVDVKILVEFIRHTKFFQNLTSASLDALGQHLRFRTCHEGQILHRQGDMISDTCGRYIVVNGSLMVYRNSQYAQRAREGEDYSDWFLASNANATYDSVRYGDCIDTCSIGDTTGDDATLGHLFREHTVVAQVKTVVAYVTRADYKYIIRYNIENESQLLDTVKGILTPPKPTKHDTPHFRPTKDGTAQSSPYASHQTHLSPQQSRALLRFLSRFKCFRVLPYQFCMELLPRLELCTVKSGEVLCTSNEDKPSMIMVLDGKLCVHTEESHETQSLRLCKGERARASTAMIKSSNNGTREYLPGCEASSAVEFSLRPSSLHICSMTGGDAFGELLFANFDYALQGASIYHPFSSTGQTSTTLVRIYRHDYETVMQRYLASGDFNFESVCTMLSQTLPQDRTDEQVLYAKTFLLHRSSARLFFTQIPSRILDGVLLHARVERHEVNEEIEDFVQREDVSVEFMRIVLNGYIGVFKGSPSPKPPCHSGDVINPVAPKTAVLRRFQSRLIRANTHVLDTSSAKQAGRRGSIVRSLPTISKPGLHDFSEDMKAELTVIDPVSILPSGAAFGQLQILTGRRKSPYAYAAFTSGPGAMDEAQSDGKLYVYLLSIPAPFVLLYLSALDGEVVYNPTKALKRLQHESFNITRSGTSPTSLIRQLHLPSLLSCSSTFRGFPHYIAVAMIEEMSMVTVDTHRLLYGCGEAVHQFLLVVLSGSVRVFSYFNKIKASRDRRGSILHTSDDKRPKLPRRISQETAEAKGEEATRIDPIATRYRFDKPAGDSVFLSDYSQTQELASGDCFGRHESSTFVRINSRRPSNNALSTRQSRSHPVYNENAVSMTGCLIGVITRHQHPNELCVEERAQLLRIIDDRDDIGVRAEPTSVDEPAYPRFNSFASYFRVLEAMGLACRLTTHRRVQAASCLQHRKLRPGECVFKQGEDGEAIYYVLFGRVSLFIKSNSDCHSDQHSKGFEPDNGRHYLDVLEGEVFGEETFRDHRGSVRFCTAAAAAEDSQDVELLFLTRQDYDCLIDTGVAAQATVDDVKNDGCLQLLGLVQRSVSAKQRWKLAIYQVIQLRAQRSHWPPVLTKARNHRIDLLLELVRGLPVFEDTPLASIKGICSNAVVQTYGADSTIYNKNDNSVDVCFLVVQGAVTLYQIHFGNAKPALAESSMPLGYVQSTEITSTKVPVCTVRAGEIFGDFEIMEEHPRRHINAVVTQPGTKLVIIQQADYLAFWPRREQMERKLKLLKSQLQSLCNLDSDQLCSLYHGTREKVFRRNEVIIGSKEQSGYLHVIQDGTCVVHDVVTLRRKKPSTGYKCSNGSALKLSLDTRISTLGPGVILFAEKVEMSVPMENRRASSRTLDTVDHGTRQDDQANQYVVADSPVVTTLSVQLFSKRQVGNQRQPDLLVLFLLGKSGLQVIRQTMDCQLRWRAANMAETSRLVASAFSQHCKRGREVVSNSTPSVGPPQYARQTKVPKGQDVSHALLLPDYDGDNNTSVAKHPSLTLSPRNSSLLVSIPLKPATTTSFGSFNLLRPSQTNQVLARSHPHDVPRLPSLLNPSSSSSFPLNSEPIPRTPGVKALNERYEQIRKEESVLISTPKPEQEEKAAKLLANQMRTRHGRPPTKRVENNNIFVNEHVVSPVVNLRCEHERKKTGLCRRILHVKGPL